MAIIAISGKIGSGKDTIGKIIQFLTSSDYDMKLWIEEEPNKALNNWNGNFDNLGSWKVKKFADKLKNMVCLLIGCTREQLEDSEFKNKELGEEWNCYEYKTSNTLPTKLTISEEEARIEGEWSYSERKLTPRLILQLLGTECGRQIIHPNIWVNSLFVDYKPTQGKGLENHTWDKPKLPDWIITDLRFPNELKAVKDREGITIRVNRARIIKHSENASYQFDPLFDKEHESETALDNAEFDYVIDNNYDINHLIEEVKKILIREKII